MEALIVIDVQNEFSATGKRPVPNHTHAIKAINQQVARFRSEGRPIAWVRHFNLPHESPAFVPGTWGAEFSPGFGPQEGCGKEQEFQKNVYGAFTGSNIGPWLQQLGVDSVMIVGFFTHGCVSTTSREAIMAGLQVTLDFDSTDTCDLKHEVLGQQTADEVKRAALLQLANMGATVVKGR
ncbi:MAG TPA: isochorismatase family cysteine hydrolase [Flavisolibacter sp.]|nr:isochorismatase family cysteine hydrolase [Flavisolibacter sp.]